MIGNWLNNFPGNWFGYWFGYKEPDFLCNSSIEVVYESYDLKVFYEIPEEDNVLTFHDVYTVSLVDELSLTYGDDKFSLSIDECPTL